MTWTAERDNSLRTLWSDGATFSAISRVLGISRSAVAGRRLRLDLPMRGKPSPLKGKTRDAWHRTKPAKPSRGKKPEKKRKRVWYSLPPLPPQPELPASAIPLEQRKTLFELRPHDCRYPYGDPGTPEFFFCGAAQERGSSYCPVHTIRVWAA